MGLNHLGLCVTAACYFARQLAICGTFSTMVCECQWGLSCLFLGGFIILAAGVFSIFPFVLGVLKYEWYVALCYLWLGLGVGIFGLGFLYEIFCCAPKQRFGKETRGRTSAREDTAGQDDIASAPTPYIMITA